MIEKLMKKYPDVLDIVPISDESDFKRIWPHIDFTWWFFVAKLRKVKSLDWGGIVKCISKVNKNIEKITNNDKKLIKRFV